MGLTSNSVVRPSKTAVSFFQLRIYSELRKTKITRGLFSLFSDIVNTTDIQSLHEARVYAAVV